MLYGRYRGVCFHSKSQRFLAHYPRDGNKTRLGSFKTETEVGSCQPWMLLLMGGVLMDMMLIVKLFCWCCSYCWCYATGGPREGPGADRV